MLQKLLSREFAWFIKFGGTPELLALAGVTLVGAAVALVWIWLNYRDRERRLWHETARLALEKGQPLPPLQNERRLPPAASGVAGDFRSGLILVGTGVGLYFFLGLGVAAIVGCTGLALLLYALLATLFARKNPPRDPPSAS